MNRFTSSHRGMIATTQIPTCDLPWELPCSAIRSTDQVHKLSAIPRDTSTSFQFVDKEE